MTNSEAIAMIRNDMKLHHDSLSGKYRKALKMAINALEKRERWIPLSERTPEPDERVAVTPGGYEYHVWDCMSNRDDDYFWEDEEGYYHNKYAVVAWMPLPEPYREEGEADGRD